MQPIQLGPGPSPRLQYVFIGGDDRWYTLDAQNNQVLFLYGSITGYLAEMQTKTTQYKGADKTKLDIYVHAGQQKFCLRTGLDTLAARSLAAALVKLRPEHLARPLTIEPVQGTSEEKAVFLNVWNPVNLEQVRTEEPLAEDRMAKAVEYLNGQLAEAKQIREAVR